MIELVSIDVHSKDKPIMSLLDEERPLFNTLEELIDYKNKIITKVRDGYNLDYFEVYFSYKEHE